MNEYNYEFINQYNSVISPSTVHVKNTGLARFFKRYLLQEAESVFDFTLPETWAKNYFLTVLYCMGYISVADIKPFGVIPQHCGIGGYTVQYQPYYVTLANPLYQSRELIIGKDCEVIRLQPDYCGLYDLVDYYGDLMALCAETMGGNILNSKMSFVFAADNKASAESYKELYDQLASGNPIAVADKKLFRDDGTLAVQMFVQNVGQNFIADKLVDTMRNIRNQFLTDIGIPNVNLAKKSGVTDSEVAANDLEVRAKISLWYDSISEDMERVRKMFGLSEDELKVEWRKPEGGDLNGMALDSGSVQSGSDDI